MHILPKITSYPKSLRPYVLYDRYQQARQKMDFLNIHKSEIDEKFYKKEYDKLALRRHKVKKRLGVETLMRFSKNPPPTMAQIIKEELSTKLTPQKLQRMITLLKNECGMTSREIADLVGATESQVLKELKRIPLTKTVHKLFSYVDILGYELRLVPKED